MTTTYTAEQKRRLAEIAKKKAEQAKLERWKRNFQILARNAELKQKMMEETK